MTKTPAYTCPRCGSTEVMPVRRFGRPLGKEQQCLACGRRWDPSAPLAAQAPSAPAKPPYRNSKLCHTPDDWAPNYNAAGVGDKQGTFVKVTLMELLAGAGWRVRVAGADDEAVERDFAANDFALACIVYDVITGWDADGVKRARLVNELNFVRG